MSSISVPHSLVSNTNPTEAQLDTIRSYLLGFFNAASLNASNIADGGLRYRDLANPTDDVEIVWDNDVAKMYYDSGTNKLVIENTVGDIIWAHREDESTLTEFMSLRFADGALEVWGTLEWNTNKPDQTVQLLWLLSRYRKPRLVYVDDNVVTVEDNATTGSKAFVMFHDQLLEIYDRTLSLAQNANGETTGDTGTAVSGLGQGLTRTANRWYYVYAVEVQFGTQANNYAILVANETAPTDPTTLDTNLGAGKWVYMGVIRNGWNVTGSTNIVVPFIYDENGYLRFTQTLTDNYPKGLMLAAQRATVNLEWAVSIGNGQAQVPPVATRVVFGGYRESHGFELQYEADATNELHFITTGCHHVSELETLEPCLYMEVPLLNGYNVIVCIGNVETEHRISCAGLLDHYL